MHIPWVPILASITALVGYNTLVFSFIVYKIHKFYSKPQPINTTTLRNFTKIN
tara:strand:+ start:76 stop:234 length:159 start_codon:yes stop_codon:yes gene_type:complete